MEPRHCGGESIKVSIVKFSPTGVDVVATAAFDWTIKIWNLDNAEVIMSPGLRICGLRIFRILTKKGVK
jgi:hypothetical protein